MRKPLTSLLCAVALVAAVPLLADDYKKPGCLELENSALEEPPWYLEECLGGVPPVVAERTGGPAPLGVDISFLHNIRAAGQFPSSLMTAPVGTLTYTLVGPNARPIFAMDFDKTATTLWGLDNTTRELGTYNLTNGVFTPTGVITGIPVGETLSGLKFDPTSDLVYVEATNGVVSNLYTFDINTRVGTLVGPIGFALVIDIAISNTGQMYGHDIGLDQLISINKTTGVGTAIGPTGFNANFAQGMDFDPSTNTLWSWLYIGGGVNNLVTFNLTTGAATLMQAGPAGPEIEGSIRVPVNVIAFTPVALAVDGLGNRVMDPAEVTPVAPTWRNDGSAQTGVAGTLSNFTGPAGGIYTIVDGSASYGDVAAGATASCGSNCYTLTAAAATRPVVHWDSTVLETLTPGGTKTWTLHIGASFTDVPPTNGFNRFVETILHRGITAGCTPTTYCPGNTTTREQMSVFVLIAKEGAGYTPPACTTPVFNDVPASSAFCRFIEELARRGVTAGCSTNPPLFCPQADVTREQMAVFVLRTLDPNLDPPACTTPIFTDVPANDPFCRWIEELFRRGVVTGCAPNQYCPDDPVTRDQMGVFLTETFSLTLYGI